MVDGKIAAEELRRRAAQYRQMAQGCAYPEGIDLLLLMADVHDDEAVAAEADRIVTVSPTLPA